MRGLNPSEIEAAASDSFVANTRVHSRASKVALISDGIVDEDRAVTKAEYDEWLEKYVLRVRGQAPETVIETVPDVQRIG